MAACIEDLNTPSLLLRRQVLEANCARMTARAAALGVALRPHLKTAKAAEVARVATAGQESSGRRLSRSPPWLKRLSSWRPAFAT